MPASELRLVRRCAERVPKSDIALVPKNTRGLYALLVKRGDEYNVIYVGMAGGSKAGIHGRLRADEKRKAEWTHFSVFEVWDNVSEAEVQELEGLFRHIYRRDAQANKLNRQRRFKKLEIVRKPLKTWKGIS